MKAIISSTYSDTYLFFLPIVTWSWNKLGIDVICFMPKHQKEYGHVMNLIWDTLKENDLSDRLVYYDCPKHKEATYAQCSRLYAATLDLPEDEILITGDVDMAVFNKDYFDQASNGHINVFGADLVPPVQLPMCYISMPVKTWRTVMEIMPGMSYQECLDKILGPIECEHFRANQWSFDQDTAYRCINRSGLPHISHMRARYPFQFATRRADRDGWPDAPPLDIIDAHLPRPGYLDENFKRILELFQDVYPDEDFTWMVEYKNEYVTLL